MVGLQDGRENSFTLGILPTDIGNAIFRGKISLIGDCSGVFWLEEVSHGTASKIFVEK
jgi:hypothetical protein